MDTRWYLDVNRFARETGWAHGFMAPCAVWGGVTVLGVLLVVGWWRARSDGPRVVAAALWAAGFGVLLAFDRVYVGAHYPTDVICGLLFGAVVVAALYPVAMWILVPIVGWLTTTPLRFFVGASTQGGAPGTGTGPGAGPQAGAPAVQHGRVP